MTKIRNLSSNIKNMTGMKIKHPHGIEGEFIYGEIWIKLLSGKEIPLRIDSLLEPLDWEISSNITDKLEIQETCKLQQQDLFKSNDTRTI